MASAAPYPFCSLPSGFVCPSCDRDGTALVSASFGPPECGDLVVCVTCGGVQIVTAAMALREFTAADLDTYGADVLARLAATVEAFRCASAKGN